MKRTLSHLFTVAALLSLPSAAAADAWYQRADGVRFDSDVGAACGALHTDILFSPDETTLEIHDQSPLDYLAQCLRSGPLAGAVVGIVAPYDGSEYGMRVAAERQLEVRDYLMDHGVRPSQLTTWRTSEEVSPWEPGRVQFRIVQQAWAR